jgi:mannose-1-phosphate guanylyltransferase
VDTSLSLSSNTWALILAGGEGSRLHGLTRNSHGVVIPKQFCSLKGGPSLLQESMQRAASVAPAERVCTVVAELHREWWTDILSDAPVENVIVQPHSRGTAHGILYPLLKIAARDPDAVVVLLPADHFVREEAIMAAALRRAAALAAARPNAIYLLGAEPDGPDAELGYIVPAAARLGEPSRVLRFVEKPSASRAQALLKQGALWNVFILAASVRALLRLFGGSFAATVMAMRELRGAALDDMYQQLRSVDFSRDLLQGNESVLQVLPVPHCGWTDLGTPQRLAATLQQFSASTPISPAASETHLSSHPTSLGHLNLANQYAWLQAGRAPAAKFGHADLHA